MKPKRRYRVLAAVAGVACSAASIGVSASAAMQDPQRHDQATTAATSSHTTPRAADAVPGAVDAANGSNRGGLAVSPSDSLFNVTLTPGSSEYRHVVLTNDSNVPLDVNLSARVVSTDGSGGAAEHLHLASSTGATCPEVEPARARVLGAESVSQGRIAPGASKQVCIGVGLTSSAAGMARSTTVADLEFDAIESLPGTGTGTGSGSGRPPQLAYTGADLTSIALAALAALLFGAAFVRRRSPLRHINPFNDSESAP